MHDGISISRPAEEAEIIFTQEAPMIIWLTFFTWPVKMTIWISARPIVDVRCGDATCQNCIYFKSLLRMVSNLTSKKMEATLITN